MACSLESVAMPIHGTRHKYLIQKPKKENPSSEFTPIRTRRGQLRNSLKIMKLINIKTTGFVAFCDRFGRFVKNQ
ncbi:hypothetical protein A3Q29_06845 [Providencia stuartii]|uniref:Uncharacterized protein n=1 Tax=Providencia stuartii TaxID=588 RepID=A0A1S1HMV3_PROST|nr:hypothetical protein A3Q29_06845 [Providencia stuartii]